MKQIPISKMLHKTLKAIKAGHDTRKALEDKFGIEGSGVYSRVRKLEKAGLIEYKPINGSIRKYGAQYIPTRNSKGEFTEYEIDYSIPDCGKPKIKNAPPKIECDWEFITKWYMRPLFVYNPNH